jgi:hypothetical protein
LRLLVSRGPLGRPAGIERLAAIRRDLQLGARMTRPPATPASPSRSARQPADGATSSTARLNASSLTFDGLVKPLIFLTNCSDAARTSASVTGRSKLNNGLMFRHMPFG